MKEPEELFQDAKTAYDYTISQLQEMFRIMTDDLAKQICPTGFFGFKNGFDIALQQSLLEMATIDGALERNELVFLDRLFEGCVTLPGCVQNGYTYIGYSDSDVASMKYLSGLFDTGAGNDVKFDFYKTFAMIDAVTKKNYYVVISDALATIGVSFLQIANQPNQYIINQARDILNNRFYTPIYDLKETALKQIDIINKNSNEKNAKKTNKTKAK